MSNDEDISKLYIFLNNYTLGPLLGSVKFILLLPILLIWFTFAWIFILLQVPFNILRGFDLVFGRISLTLMGFYSIPRKRMIIRPAIVASARPYESFSLHTEKSVNPSDWIAAGDWIMANLTSYCDLIVYWYSYSGIVTILRYGTTEIDACPNRFKVLWYYFMNTNFDEEEESSCSSIGNTTVYPLIIFPEGSSSNGRGVLKFLTNLSSSRRNQRIHLTCTKFQSSIFTPTFPNPSISGFFFHLWRLCCQLENTLTSRTILPAALFSSNFDLPSASDAPIQFNRTLQQIIAALGHLRPLNLDFKDKISFLKSFKEEKKYD